jgi:hypothetical protein
MEENEPQTRIHWHMQIQDIIGTIFLGIISILLIKALIKSEERNRTLMLQWMERH